MIIIEGMDNSGKSTLAEFIGSRTRVPVEHSPSELVRSGRYEEWLYWIEWSLLGERGHYVFDRHPILSEPVYGPVCRGRNLLETTSYLIELKERDPFILYCRPPDEKIFNFEKEEADGVIEHAVELLNAYDDFFHKIIQSGFDVYVYDYTSVDSEHSILPKIVRYLQGKPSFRVIQGGKADG